MCRIALGRKPGDDVGTDREFRPRRLEPFDQRDRLSARMPPPHPLEHQVIARLQREVDVRHDPRLLRQQLEQQRVDLDPVERGQTQAGQGGHAIKDGGDQRAEAWGGVAGEVDSGQDDFGDAVLDQQGDL